MSNITIALLMIVLYLHQMLESLAKRRSLKMKRENNLAQTNSTINNTNGLNWGCFEVAQRKERCSWGEITPTTPLGFCLFPGISV